ncbi:unnamed protein product [Caenorhabditis sp. 36 PRJEB53466]|nr:unnamed protein product [Caenorhabditis sp. 36 PRJEB53466]
MSRERANERERNRQKSIGKAFNALRSHLPKQLRDRKPSKAETLKSAVQYISHMLRVLEAETQKNFSPVIKKEIDFAYATNVWMPPEQNNGS